MIQMIPGRTDRRKHGHVATRKETPTRHNMYERIDAAFLQQVTQDVTFHSERTLLKISFKPKSPTVISVR